MSRRKPATGPTIALFPFLAVLLCMMGALLVLLVLFSRSASQAGDEAITEAIDQLELARDSARWRREQLALVRQRTGDDLSRARMLLAGVEENTRQLEDELGRFARTAQALETDAKEADAADLAALEARLTNARESLDTAREDLAKRPPAYAVVPYVGRHGTHRRPLYVECSVDGVYLQPEGIRLAPGDFEGPPGPGNPLASALRAAREQISRSAPNSGDPAAQPYPLLLVRPSGVMAYYAAREAIASWGNEFGYQLIEDDWTIAYPPADPALAEAEKRAIEESRRRLQWLAEHHPQRPAKPQRQYRAAPTRGGVVENGAPSVLGDQSQWEWKEQQASGTPTPGGGRGRGGSGFGTSAPGQDGPGGTGGSTSGSVAGTGGMAGGSGTGGPNGLPGGTGPGGPGSGGDGVGPGRPFTAGAQDDGDPAGDPILSQGGQGGSFAAGPPRGGRGGPAAGNGAMSGGPEGSAGAGSAFGQAGMAGQRGQGSPGGTSLTGGAAAGGTDGSGDGSPEGSAEGTAPVGNRYGAAGGSTFAGGSTGAGGSSAAGGQSGGAALGVEGNGSNASGGAGGSVSMPGMLSVGGGAGGSGASAGGSIAGSRGANWASLETHDHPVPLTRPIHVECALGEFRILDDTGRRIQSRVPIDGDTAAAIDPFVGALHKKVRGWGLAGDRMYWRPELVLSATNDGQTRRDDLERLLADSGIDIRPRDGREPVVPLPPVQRASYNVPLRNLPTK